MKWYRKETLAGPRWTPRSKVRRNDEKHFLVPELLSVDPTEVAEAAIRVLNRGDYIYNGIDGIASSDVDSDSLESVLPEELPPPGQYRWDYSEEELIPVVGRNERTVPMHTGVYADMESYVRLFINSRSKYASIGAHYHAGCLIYGPPGTGKSTIIRQLLNTVCSELVCVWMSNIPDTDLCEALTAIPGPKVVILEEITNINLSYLLAFLDGEDTIDGGLVLATTNYPQKLAKNLLDRPSRFDKIFEFSLPNKQARYSFLEKFGILSPEELEMSANETVGYSLDYLRELLLFKVVHGITLSEAHALVKERKEHAKRIANMPLTQDGAWRVQKYD